MFSGLHLNLTEGLPVSDPTLLPSLVHNDGGGSGPVLLGKMLFRRHLEENMIDLQQVGVSYISNSVLLQLCVVS